MDHQSTISGNSSVEQYDTSTGAINPIRAFIYTGLLVIVAKFLWNVVQNNRRYSHLPQPSLSPILGTIFGHLEHFFYLEKKTSLTSFFASFVFQNARSLQEKGEGLMRFRMGPFHNTILIFDGKTAETLLSQKSIAKPIEYELLKPLLGNGLVMTNGQEWKSARKALVPAFNQANLNRILPIMNEKTMVLSNILAEQFTDSDVCQIDDIQQLMINLSIDMILATSMGINLNAQRNWADKNLKQCQRHETPEERYHTSLEIAFSKIMLRVLNPFYKNDWIFNTSEDGKQFQKNVKVVHDFTTDVILKRKQSFEEECRANPCARDNVLMPALDLMLKYNSENSSVFDVESIYNHVTTLIFGGHDTSATLSSYFFFRIGSLPEVQKKLHQEVDRIFNGDIERDITLEDIRQMPFLEACIKEALRLHPPIGLFGRHVLEDVQCGRYLIPKDATVLIASTLLHRDPHTYTEPHSFKPERFLESSYKFHQAGYLPFGSGPRVCIGFTYAMQSLKILFVQILRRFQLESLVQINDLRFFFGINNKISSPIPMRIRMRQPLNPSPTPASSLDDMR